ncbi:MAG: hypothetical protein ABW321_00855 [Polyangiales bacterium]
MMSGLAASGDAFPRGVGPLLVAALAAVGGGYGGVERALVRSV